MTIDPRDEGLFKRYFTAILSDGVETDRAVTGSRELAVRAVAEHRALFPLPDPKVIPAPAVEPWRAVIRELWVHNSPASLVALMSMEHPADVIELEIERMLAAGVLYERPDKTLAIERRYRDMGTLEGPEAIGIRLEALRGVVAQRGTTE
jgi:hypothetical protein